MSAATDKTWSDKAVAKLIAFAAQDLSAQAIAEKLCAAGIYVSRNAVIGKCHRDGIALAQPPGSRPGGRGPGHASASARSAPVSASVSPAPMPKARRADATSAVPAPVRPPRQVSKAAPMAQGVPASRAEVSKPPRPPVDPELVQGFMAFRRAMATARHPAGGYPLGTAQDSSCSWPMGGAGRSLRVCGAGRADGSSYCPGHTKLAHQPTRRLNHWAADASVHPTREAESGEPDLCDLIGEGS